MVNTVLWLFFTRIVAVPQPYPQRELANEEDLEIIKSYEKANYIKRDAIEAKERFEKRINLLAERTKDKTED